MDQNVDRQSRKFNQRITMDTNDTLSEKQRDVFNILEFMSNIELPSMNTQKNIVVLKVMEILIACSDIIGEIMEGPDKYLIDPKDEKMIEYLILEGVGGQKSQGSKLCVKKQILYYNTKHLLAYYKKINSFLLKYYFSHLYSFHDESIDCHHSTWIIQSTYGSAMMERGDGGVNALKKNNVSISELFETTKVMSKISKSSKFRSDGKSSNSSEQKNDQDSDMDATPLIYEFERYKLLYDNLEYDNHDKPAMHIWLEIRDIFVYVSTLNIAIASKISKDTNTDGTTDQDTIDIPTFSIFYKLLDERIQKYAKDASLNQDAHNHGKRVGPPLSYNDDIVVEEMEKQNMKHTNNILDEAIIEEIHENFIDSDSHNPQASRNMRGHKRPRFFDYKSGELGDDADKYTQNDLFLSSGNDAKKKKEFIFPVVLLDIVNDFLRNMEYETIVRRRPMEYFATKHMLPIQHIISRYMSNGKIDEDHEYLFLYTTLTMYYYVHQMTDTDAMLTSIYDENKQKIDMIIQDAKSRFKRHIPYVDSNMKEVIVQLPSIICSNGSHWKEIVSGDQQQQHQTRVLPSNNDINPLILSLLTDGGKIWNSGSLDAFKSCNPFDKQHCWYKTNVILTVLGPDYDHTHPFRNSHVIPNDFDTIGHLLNAKQTFDSDNERNGVIASLDRKAKNDMTKYPMLSLVNNHFVASDEMFSTWKIMPSDPSNIFTLNELHVAYEYKMHQEESKKSNYERMSFDMFLKRFRTLCNYNDTPKLFDDYYKMLFYPSIFESGMKGALFTGDVSLQLEIIFMKLSAFPMCKRLYCYYRSADIRPDFRRKSLEMLTSAHMNFFRTLQFFHIDTCDWVEDNMSYEFVKSDEDLMTKVPFTGIIPMILLSTHYCFIVKFQYQYWIYRYLVPFESWCKYTMEVCQHSFEEPLIIQTGVHKYQVIYNGILFDGSSGVDNSILDIIGGKKEQYDEKTLREIKNLLSGRSGVKKDMNDLRKSKERMRDHILSSLWLWMLFVPDDIRKCSMAQMPWVQEWNQTNKDISVHKILTTELSGMSLLIKTFFPSKHTIISDISDKIFEEHLDIQLDMEKINLINQQILDDLSKQGIQQK